MYLGRWQSRLIATLLTGALVGGGLAISQPAYAAEWLTIDAGSDTGPVTHAASGFLNGLSENAQAPADNLIAPLKPQLFRGSGAKLTGLNGSPNYGWIGDGYRAGPGYQRRIQYTINVIRRALSPTLNSRYVVLLNDIYGSDDGQPSNAIYPCDNGDCSNWITFIRKVHADISAAGLADRVQWEIYNEPAQGPYLPRPTNGAQYFQIWDTAYRELKRLMPNAAIVGPSYTDFYEDQVAQFLDHTKAAGTVPQILNWHTLFAGGDPKQEADIARRLLNERGIPVMPFQINEYGMPGLQNPGSAAWFLSRIQAGGIREASRAVWGPCCATPNLSGVLTNGQTSPEWWTYKTYGDMTGTHLNTFGGGSMAAIASKDQNSGRMIALLGSKAPMDNAPGVAADFTNVPTWIQNAGQVRAEVWRLPSVDDDDNTTAGPVLVRDQVLTVSNGSLYVPINWQGRRDAYSIYLSRPGTPGGAITMGSQILGPGAKCVDVVGDDNGANGAAAQLWDCNSGARDQHWTFVGTTLRTMNRCLDVAGNSSANGAAVQLWDCNDVGGQQWIQQANGTLLNPQSGRCLDSPGGATANGSLLRIWDCPAQPFRVGSAIDAPGGRCIDAAGDDVGENGAAIQLWDCQTNAADQKWALTDGTLRSMNRCLDIAGNSTANNAAVQLWDCNGVGGQQWVQQANGTLLNPQSGRCLSIPADTTTNGTRLQIATCSGTWQQAFRLR